MEIIGVSPFERIKGSETSSEPVIDAAELPVDMPLHEVIRRGAVDSEFYSRVWFPKTFRQGSPKFHRQIWDDLENPAFTNVLEVVFRGGAKTTILRTFASKRVAYGVSRTILWIGGNEGAASRSLMWLRRQVEFNTKWASAFGLTKGSKWGDTELEIRNTILDISVWIKAVGVLSNLRGINFDDYRPDLIILDDVIDDENATTQEGREKMTEIIMGAVAKSLISKTEEPNAKLAMLQTPLHDEDAAGMVAKAEGWKTNHFSCWTPETADLDVDQQESAWPEMFPTEQLRTDKRNMIKLGKLHIFLREMECRLASPGTSAFIASQLQYYENLSEFANATIVISIDPVPPPTQRQIDKNLHNKDFEAIVVQARKGPKYALLHYELMRGHDPGWTLSKLFEFHARFHASYVSVETIAYQKTLEWLIRQEMSRRQQWLSVIPVSDGRSKFHRIVDSFRPLLNNGAYYCRRSHSQFISDITQYPRIQYPDLLDACAQGLRALISPAMELGQDEFHEVDESAYKPIDYSRIKRAP